MFIEVHAAHVEGHDKWRDYAETEVAEALKRIEERITSVEVHLKDENAGKADDKDKYCSVEAHVRGLPAVAVKQEGENFKVAIDGAVEKLKQKLLSTFERLRDSER